MNKKIFVVVVVMYLITLIIVKTVADTPVVFKSRSGETCGCMVDQNYPTLSQCDRVKDQYELINVSSCK